MSAEMRIVSHSPAETAAIGCGLGRLLDAGDILCLAGRLGAGKTCLARGISSGLGVDPSEVSSPTFVLAQEYRGRVPVYHLDLYRLSSAEDVENAGLDEYFGGNGVAVVEWPEAYGLLEGYDHLSIRIEPGPDDDSRVLVFRPQGGRYRRILEEMQSC
ncbi:MAG: tRNA (adenosine(37)-N6)-threonylcarbamoyltransferase complex ATPase subunit type 1 TsaE [Clostridia bacterium]|nr:tRNA (adenosine(37)-N6)-threonylcarbamoyltransferase complex ATPase subunit type 1 TsaE [Clostridia bacterium]